MRGKNRKYFFLEISCFRKCRLLLCLILLHTRRTDTLSVLVNTLLTGLFHITLCYN